jgi:hypothetical protein
MITFHHALPAPVCTYLEFLLSPTTVAVEVEMEMEVKSAAERQISETLPLHSLISSVSVSYVLYAFAMGSNCENRHSRVEGFTWGGIKTSIVYHIADM